jgi:hypothetical protein
MFAHKLRLYRKCLVYYCGMKGIVTEQTMSLQ